MSVARDLPDQKRLIDAALYLGILAVIALAVLFEIIAILAAVALALAAEGMERLSFAATARVLGESAGGWAWAATWFRGYRERITPRVT